MKPQTTASSAKAEISNAADSIESMVQENLSQTVNQLADKVSETKSQLMDVAREELSELSKLSDEVLEQTSQYAKKLEATIKKHPVLSALAAAGLGAIIVGVVTKSLSSKA